MEAGVRIIGMQPNGDLRYLCLFGRGHAYVGLRAFCPRSKSAISLLRSDSAAAL
ncbi:MAG: hypothetical protein QOF22_2430 [Bradyrhizobium sp.]|jgi:hypothetical protein|nr:hypothetical protein [Bradyrhizobium sp.]